jgi:uncharacterized caspase-like protein
VKARATPWLGVGLALLVAAAPVQAQKPQAERPTYAVGERWVRNDGVYELLRIEGDHYVFAASADRQVHLTRDLMLARVQRGHGLMEFDPPPKLTWPLELGKSGSSWGTWRWDGNSAGAYTRFTWNVAAFGEVPIPGGTVKAFRIELRMDTQQETQQRGRQPRTAYLTLWYAPQARQLVKITGVNHRGEPWGMPSFVIASLDRPEPLRIVLEAPVLEGDRALVKGTAHSGSGVTEVHVMLNGAPVARESSRDAPKPDLDFSVPVPLTEGRNVVLVTAVDASGDRRQEARVLVREGAGLGAAGPRPPGARLGAGLPGPLARPGAPDRPVLDRPAPDRPLPERVPERPQPAPVATTPPAPVVSTPAPATTALAAPAPLTIALSAPADRARVEQDATVLAGIVSGSKGVARVIVTLNGTEVSRQEDKAPRPAVALNVPLKLAEGSNTIVVTAADVDGRLSQELRSVQFDKLTPLTVAFRYPEDRARVSEGTSVVAALLTSSKGVASAKVLLNGAEVWAQSERAPQKSVAVAVPVTLRPGANAIVLTAAETDGTVRQEVRTIVYEPPAVVAAIPPAATAPPAPAHDRWAVVIGVSNYESAAIPRLRYTVPDAEAVYQALVGVGGFKKDNVLLLTDRAERKPTLRNIKWALGTFLSRSARKDDTVVIFFAGHGAPDVDTRGIERDGLAKYLIPSDADPDDLYSTALPMDELQTIFGRIEAERVVAFLDACYSGAARGGRTFSSKLTRAGNIDDLFLERLTRSKGRAIVTASRTNEVSMELPELGHGIFSYYLVNGLKGAADLNRDGIVSLQELYEYVEPQVSVKSRSVGGNQHPVMKGELEGALPLVKVRGK